jgi:hypothetical protein
MKTTLLIFLFCLFFAVLKAQDEKLAGTWTIYEFSWTNEQGKQVTTEEQIKAEDGITEYVFTDDGHFTLTTNMADETRGMTTLTGTWKFEEGKLTLDLKMGDQQVEMAWNAEIKDNILNLVRSSPDGNLTVVNSFRRK